MAPTLIDVIQGYNVGVLDPEKRQEQFRAEDSSTNSPVPADPGKPTKDLHPTWESRCAEVH